MAKRVPAKSVRKVEGRKRAGYDGPFPRPSVPASDADGTDAPAVSEPDDTSASVGADEQPPEPVVASIARDKAALLEGEHTYDYTIVIEGVGPHDQANMAAETAAQMLFDAGHNIRAAHITTRTNGPQNIRVLRY